MRGTIQVFYGKTIFDALAKAKMTLGPDILLLDQQKIEPRGFLSKLFKKEPQWKVVVSVPEKNFSVSTKHYSKVKKESSGEIISSEKLQKELAEIKEQISMLIKPETTLKTKKSAEPVSNPVLMKIKEALLENDIGEDLIEVVFDSVKKEFEEKIEKVDEEYVLKEIILQKFKEFIRVGNLYKQSGRKPIVIMFTGPTGTGKTTTLVKLAARYLLKENKQVEILTIDNYKIGGADQLKAYAEIMNCEFKATTKPQEFKNEIKKSKADIILVDTAGRSQKDEFEISKLKEFTKGMSTYTIIPVLVLSAGTKKKDLMDICNRYSKLNYKYVIFTKLDETISTGNMVDLLYRIGKPLAFVSYGQKVPEQLDIPDLNKIVKRIIPEEE